MIIENLNETLIISNVFDDSAVRLALGFGVNLHLSAL
jgi:hypothetical protein